MTDRYEEILDALAKENSNEGESEYQLAKMKYEIILK